MRQIFAQLALELACHHLETPSHTGNIALRISVPPSQDGIAFLSLTLGSSEENNNLREP